MKLAHEAFGAVGGPVALLVHGAFGASTTWTEVSQWLAKDGYDVIAVDQRGHGASQTAATADSGRVTVEDLADDLVETVEGLRPDVEAVDLLMGHSLGTIVSLACVAKYPWFARTLVLEDPPGNSRDFDALADDIRESLAQAREDRLARFELYWANADPRMSDEDISKKIAAFPVPDPDVLAPVVQSIGALDYPTLARECDVPTLVIVGRDKGTALERPTLEDLAQFSALSGKDRRVLRELLPKATFVELDAGHDIHETLCAEFIYSIDSWLGELKRRLQSREATRLKGSRDELESR